MIAADYCGHLQKMPTGSLPSLGRVILPGRHAGAHGRAVLHAKGKSLILKMKTVLGHLGGSSAATRSLHLGEAGEEVTAMPVMTQLPHGLWRWEKGNEEGAVEASGAVKDRGHLPKTSRKKQGPADLDFSPARTLLDV